MERPGRRQIWRTSLARSKAEIQAEREKLDAEMAALEGEVSELEAQKSDAEKKATLLEAKGDKKGAAEQREIAKASSAEIATLCDLLREDIALRKGTQTPEQKAEAKPFWERLLE